MDEHDRNATHLSTTQAAHAAGISRQRMLQLIKDQKVPAIETRTGYRVARDAVAYLRSERRLINDQRALATVGHDLAEEMQRSAARIEPTVLHDLKTFEETIKRASPLAVAEIAAPFTAALRETMRAEATLAPLRRYAEEMEAIRARMSDESRQALQIAAKLAAQTTVDGGIARAMDDLRRQVEALKALVLGGKKATQAPMTEHPTTERGAHWQREHGTSDPVVVLDRFAAMRAKTRGEAADATAIIRASRDGGLARE